MQVKIKKMRNKRIVSAITLKQPWATLVVKGIKDIENRTWKCPEKYIGERILIHAAAKGWRWIEVINYLSANAKAVLNSFGYDAIWLKQLPTCSIIGSVKIVDCVINHPSIWAEKTDMLKLGKLTIEQQKPVYNWVLAEPIEFEKPIPAKGKLSFWQFDTSEIAECLI